jgi:hypothetical protein
MPLGEPVWKFVEIFCHTKDHKEGICVYCLLFSDLISENLYLLLVILLNHSCTFIRYIDSWKFVDKTF